jgi:hypothetical protein
MFLRPGKLSWSVIGCRTDIVRAGVVVVALKCLVYLQTRSLILNRRLTDFSIRLLFTSLRRNKESRCWGYNKFSRCPALLVNVRHHGSNGIYRWMQRSPPRNLPVGTAHGACHETGFTSNHTTSYFHSEYNLDKFSWRWDIMGFV